MSKLTQREFADKYGLSTTTLSRLENGETREIMLPTLGKLLEAAKDTGA
jgi:transcriptional regulator with XRE-family HTH domain